MGISTHSLINKKSPEAHTRLRLLSISTCLGVGMVQYQYESFRSLLDVGIKANHPEKLTSDIAPSTILIGRKPKRYRKTLVFSMNCHFLHDSQSLGTGCKADTLPDFLRAGLVGQVLEPVDPIIPVLEPQKLLVGKLSQSLTDFQPASCCKWPCVQGHQGEDTAFLRVEFHFTLLKA
ncbi:hypothetical protein CL653_00645 [bacterium]|mgnify:CR=1 FL=1|nr:hypothetical protein [bacterium]